MSTMPKQFEVTGFNYHVLPREIAEDVKKATVAIKRNIAGPAIKAGQHLIKVKEQLDHGQFNAWLRSEFNFSLRTAERYMRAAQLQAKNDIVSHLKSTALYALAAPSMPASIQATVISKLENGEDVNESDIKQMLNKKRQAQDKFAKARTGKTNCLKKPKTKKLLAIKGIDPGNSPAVQSKLEYPQFIMKAEVRKEVMQQLPPADKPYFWARIRRMNDDQLIIVELAKHRPTK